MIEQLHKNLRYSYFAVLDSFGFMAVEPTLSQTLSFSNLQIIFIMILHYANHLGNFRKSHMQ